MALTTDLRHSVRLLGRSPIFTVTSILSLALGIGAAATIYSLTDALLFEPTVGVREPTITGRPRSLGSSRCSIDA